MKISNAGRKGGLSKSAVKRAAAQANGKRGGRPRSVQSLLRRMREMYAKIKDDPDVKKIDPGDLGLIVERLCRGPSSGRRFFIRPLGGGAFGF